MSLTQQIPGYFDVAAAAAPTLLQQILEHFGIAVAAVTGVLAARGKHIDLFGALVLGLVTAFGGGTVRDLMVGDLPVVWLRGPAYLLNAVSAALLTFFVARVWLLPRQVLLVADAFALALFTMIGARKGVALHLSGSVAVFLGVVTGVAGGMLRDVLVGEMPLVFQPAIHLYATAAMIGAVVFTVLCHLGVPYPVATPIGVLLVLGLRLAGIRWRLSLPMFEPQEPPPTSRNRLPISKL
ncbi:MAG TPA: trimeric intracellular cation channel family protein [Dongiaceae bacterium]|jgi:uncharacterized membrane protein YeiH|nr:trimeric intracellular cation channel family protein [Dongiaceae bacterium]